MLSAVFKASKRFFHSTPNLERSLAALNIGIPREQFEGERRVAQTPTTVKKLVKKGFNVAIESNAGLAAGFNDQEFISAGASIADKESILANSDLLLKIRPPSLEEAQQMKPGSTLVSMVQAEQNPGLLDVLAEKKDTVFAMEKIPRITTAQSMDVLSSMSNIAGCRAVVEAAHAYGRLFQEQFTAAGRSPPAKVLVIGGGVAGLAAMAALKSMGATVSAFDTRPEVREQVESLGAKFLELEGFKLEGGSGGYAKVMSEEFIKAEMELFAKEAKTSDIIITIAQIPGKQAPRLITKEMVDTMKPGSVIVDLAAETGGNCECTVKDILHETENGVKVIGYCDLPSRLPTQSSTLFANNIYNFVESMINEDDFAADWEEPIHRCSALMRDGEILEPMPAPVPPQVRKPEVPVELPVEEPKTPFQKTLQQSLITSGVLMSLLGIGASTSDPALSPMYSTLILSGLIGYGVVNGVTPALHSPLMSVTNAISGMTAVGGLALMGGLGGVPNILAASALLMSSVNIAGGFLVTKRMLDTFKRPTDPKEHNYLFMLPAAAAVGTYATAMAMGCPEVTNMAYLASGLCCIGGIAGLSSQKTARLGNSLGMVGVGLGLSATVGALGASPLLLGQMAGVMGIGGALGLKIGKDMKPESLPQVVAGFHSLVGLAATATCMSSYMLHPTGDFGHMLATFLGTGIGAITATGSLVAFGKLDGRLASRALALPGRHAMNAAMALGTVATGAAFLAGPSSTAAGMAMLGTTTALTGALGAHMTASIGGADMPVVVTVLNSYSGWALAAEGFMLHNPLLSVVGSLIGMSGFILSHIMCKAMNRSILSVILGGLGAPVANVIEVADGAKATMATVEHAAERLMSANKVMIVPGYGMAVSKAQWALADIANDLIAQGKEVSFGIHPVAGRMPGQMNVLLSDAGVDYENVFEMDEVNEDFSEYDVVLAIGANDTFNPNAGMPVLKVWDADKVFIMKRSLGAGYADISNPVFFNDNTDMLLGDAKATCDNIRMKLKEMFDE